MPASKRKADYLGNENLVETKRMRADADHRYFASRSMAHAGHIVQHGGLHTPDTSSHDDMLVPRGDTYDLSRGNSSPTERFRWGPLETLEHSELLHLCKELQPRYSSMHKLLAKRTTDYDLLHERYRDLQSDHKLEQDRLAKQDALVATLEAKVAKQAHLISCYECEICVNREEDRDGQRWVAPLGEPGFSDIIEKVESLYEESEHVLEYGTGLKPFHIVQEVEELIRHVSRCVTPRLSIRSKQDALTAVIDIASEVIQAGPDVLRTDVLKHFSWSCISDAFSDILAKIAIHDRVAVIVGGGIVRAMRQLQDLADRFGCDIDFVEILDAFKDVGSVGNGTVGRSTADSEEDECLEEGEDDADTDDDSNVR